MSTKKPRAILPPPEWSEHTFAAWLERMGWTSDDAAEALDMSERQIREFAQGRAKVRSVVALACMELERPKRRANA